MAKGLAYSGSLKKCAIIRPMADNKQKLWGLFSHVIAANFVQFKFYFQAA